MGKATRGKGDWRGERDWFARNFFHLILPVAIFISVLLWIIFFVKIAGDLVRMHP